MPHKADILDLARLVPSPGDGRRVDLDVNPGAFTYAEQTYSPGEATEARVDLSRTLGGYAMRLRFVADVAGPCVRCLEPGGMRIEVDAREVEQPGSSEDELRSPYVEGDELDVAAWAHDALALAMPVQFLCRPDCAGLCPVCGVSLNDADPAEHRHESGGDPRFAKLRELQ